MPGDYSRKLFNSRKHYSGVLMQQGRVQLDADWNEQVDIAQYRTQTETRDVIGLCGVPKKDVVFKGDSFKIEETAGQRDLSIAPGRIYVGGLLCELEETATYTNQPYYPNPEHTAPATSPPSSPPSLQLDLEPGTYLVYIEAWQREITALDDKRIREVALGGPDTTTRLQTAWQVKLLPSNATSPPASPPTEVSCATFADFAEDILQTTGLMNAQTTVSDPEEDPCQLPPTAGYRRLENQLYRVQIQSSGNRSNATFKWSRDNATVETKIESFDGDTVTVTDLGKDEFLGFAGDQWVEIVDEESELNSSPRQLVQIDSVDPQTREIKMKTSVAGFAGLQNARLRRWDQKGASAISSGVRMNLAPWIDLEDGIQVNFSNGNYKAGDYWLIPARTATGEIEWPPYEVPNLSPVPQPHVGVDRHFCRLAVIELQNGLVTVVDDCRKKFPPLTNICADDVCYDNANCDLSDATTVQEALDHLCEVRDLAWHNKHLHGSGIVCGLQVECGPDSPPGVRRNVTVRPGYAIDCEGRDLVLKDSQRIDILDLISRTIPGATVGGATGGLQVQPGEYCLVLESAGKEGGRFSIERGPSKARSSRSILEGTLLQDFFDDCVRPLIDLLRDELTASPPAAQPVGAAQKRLIAVLNLLVQLTDRTNGGFVYLSGERGQVNPNSEHTILRDLYERLRSTLHSHTFCAMFESARPFPEYPFNGLNTPTIFGKGLHTRFRVAPNNTTGYSVGSGNKINVYDLANNRMVSELEFPGGPNVEVQDVAVSSNGSQLIAIATINNNDTSVAIADISGFNHTFRTPTTIPNLQLVTLAAPSFMSPSVCAIGKGTGLFVFNPASIPATLVPRAAFNAVGHLAIADVQRLAFATANSGIGQTTVYNRVFRVNLTGTVAAPKIFQSTLDVAGALIPFEGQDDIAVAAGSTQGLLRLFVVDRTSGNRRALIYNGLDTANEPTPIGTVDLGEDTAIRLANNPVTSNMMVTFEGSYRIALINPNNALVAGFRRPVQIAPLAIVVSPNQQRVFVLNRGSNTITSIPAQQMSPTNQINLQALANYRADVIDAYADLLGGVLQYLKDCFCDHLLINCPTCDEDDKIYLACIQVTDGEVFKICNFSLRKYVKSFRTVEYWLSLVPIIPAVKFLIERFCCTALPNFFAEFKAPRPDAAEPVTGLRRSSFGVVQVQEGLAALQNLDLRAAIGERFSGLGAGRQILGDFLTNAVSQTATVQPSVIRQADIVGKNLEDVQKRFEEANVSVVAVQAYNPDEAGANLVRFVGTPPQLAAGSRVTLFERDGVVQYYSISRQSVADTTVQPVATAEAEILRREIVSLREEMERTRTESAKELAQRDAEIDRLKTATASIETNVKSIAEVQRRTGSQIDILTRREPKGQPAKTPPEDTTNVEPQKAPTEEKPPPATRGRTRKPKK
jgi:hypothetical protein